MGFPKRLIWQNGGLLNGSDMNQPWSSNLLDNSLMEKIWPVVLFLAQHGIDQLALIAGLRYQPNKTVGRGSPEN